MDKKWYNSTLALAFRWLFFFPLALLGGTIGSIIFVLLQKWSIGIYLDTDSFIMKYIFTFITGSTFAVIFLFLIILIVPKFKKTVLIISFVLLTLFSIWLLYVMSNGEYYRIMNSDINAQERDVINLCGTLFACFYALYEVIKKGGIKALDEIIENP